MLRKLIWSLCLAATVAVVAAPALDALQVAFNQRWGSTNANKFSAWREFLGTTTGSETERLRRANDFFNRNIVFGDDQVVWGQLDYWATPLETLGKGMGDCEDFVIAKYFTLQMLGVPSEKLRLIYVRARTGSSETTPSQAHMVLAYYAVADAEPLILDNLVGEVRPASRRPDLSPVFSFNSKGIFAGAGNTEIAPAVGSGRLSRWEDLLRRTRNEGFE